jgi:hypothetical protein
MRDLMNLLSGIRKEDVFVFGTFLGVPETRLRDIEYNFSDDHQRLLTEVYTQSEVVKNFQNYLCMQTIW